MSIDRELINTVWSIHTVKYYSDLKRKEILTHATTWMKLEVKILREIRQLQKDTHCMIPYMESVYEISFHIFQYMKYPD